MRAALERPRPAVRALDLVVMAASAGGVAALQEILGALPADFPAAVVVVLHRGPDYRSVLRQVLQRSTRMRVKDALGGDPLEAGTVYVAPSDRHVSVRPDHTIELRDGRRISRVRSSADPLFASAAAAFGPRVTAIVLSGTGRNGAVSVPSIKATGGRVIVQDRASATYFNMPAAAIATGAVDAILPPALIAEELVRLASWPSGAD
jgi:two-component system, chemotaxis family, protein-glutamate methylesterase/glutaminase